MPLVVAVYPNALIDFSGGFVGLLSTCWVENLLKGIGTQMKGKKQIFNGGFLETLFSI